ncbi:hypothetical protein [Nocardia wallacei]|uniref:hypothetical protein n=1 Tax=Nocardia wallacei TaxID=480035 RepID=UPI00245428C1|nr:hypothetical protein [Nocardia wallacei]
MDVGQSTANGLYQQAVAGTFQMEEGAAQRCAEIFQRFAESMDDLVADTAMLHVLSGFGGFDSALHLQRGFQDKGVKLTEALRGLREAALRMAAAYLHAGGRIEEAENMNKLAIKAAEAGLRK